MKISLIVALASNRAIGLNGQIPWYLPADLKHFKKVTMGAPIIMGRKTFEAIGRPLPGRRNVVISRNLAFAADGVECFTTLPAALQACADAAEIFVIGGATLYAAMLCRADFLYLTEIHQAFDGDTFFPEFDQRDWSEIDRCNIDQDKQAGFSYSFVKLMRVVEG